MEWENGKDRDLMADNEGNLRRDESDAYATPTEIERGETVIDRSDEDVIERGETVIDRDTDVIERGETVIDPPHRLVQRGETVIDLGPEDAPTGIEGVVDEN